MSPSIALPGDHSPSYREALGPPGCHDTECTVISAGRRDLCDFGQPAWACHLTGRKVGTSRAMCLALPASSCCPGMLSWKRLGHPSGRGLGEAGKVTSFVISSGPQCWSPKYAPRAVLGLHFPQQRDTPPNTAATFATLLSKVFGGKHPC